MFLIQSIYIAPLVAIYVLTCLVAKLYCVACSGESKWYIWVPFGVREVAVCEASENMHPIGLRSMYLWIICAVQWVCFVIGICMDISLPYSYDTIAQCFLFVSALGYIALYVFTCVYIYYVASDVSKRAMVWVVLHTLLGFLVDPIIYHYIARDIEQEA